ncbi:MAG TPA: alpha/beta hydrolase [Burkholderiales bacterium]|nr:alpha/beta hydrolase [Burkholderiales bacterium]
MQTGHARSGELQLFYRRTGRPGATPLLIVHGLSYFSYDWIPVAEQLGRDRDVVAMDMRGFGDSDWSLRQDYSVPSMGGDIVTLLDQLGWRRAVLIGHSMGGRSATFAAARYADRVAGLVLVDYSPENAPGGSQRVARTVANTPERFASVDEALRYFAQSDRARMQAYLRPDGSIKRDPYFREQFKRMLETGERPKLGVDMWQLIGEVRCPILSLRGTRSDMYAAETVSKMRAANPRLEVVEVDGGHNIAGDNAAGFVAAVRAFLNRLEESHANARR